MLADGIKDEQLRAGFIGYDYLTGRGESRQVWNHTANSVGILVQIQTPIRANCYLASLTPQSDLRTRRGPAIPSVTIDAIASHCVNDAIGSDHTQTSISVVRDKNAAI